MQSEFLAGCSFLVVGLYPVFPVLACGAILATEFESRDFCVADFALLGSLGSEVLDVGIGQRDARLAIEDEGPVTSFIFFNTRCRARKSRTLRAFSLTW